MLVLTRKTCEQIKIGNDITITILRVRGQAVRIGVEAPKTMRVLRSELPVNGDHMDLTPASADKQPAIAGETVSFAYAPSSATPTAPAAMAPVTVTATVPPSIRRRAARLPGQSNSGLSDSSLSVGAAPLAARLHARRAPSARATTLLTQS